ncbi:Protein of unknown function DUF933 [Desulfonatronospira thiodismutans ASO3-1]|uniref:TGS domain-containing protein n=1 Tax=Desulfonatronospira thiodismutans ASO3-1 TaxID=555779 RepID=D6SQD3_9BACT|nr:DUF933 domain-containing protein [Desulfonatronospira thiodismutans]EFI34959.1 Protein of unknown function DUF933 [Desulfonatronospira thiodismutans ASO3-1]
MKTAIIGFSGSGKTELFKALAGPGTPGNRAAVKVPEPRLEPLCDLFKPKKITHTEIEFQDLPGGGSNSLGNKVLSDIRGFECLLAVLDAYTGTHDPAAQQSAIEAELIIADLAVIEKKLERMQEDKKKAKHLHDQNQEELLNKARQVLEQDSPLREYPDLAAHEDLRGFAFLSSRPVLYAWNVAEDSLSGFKTPPESTGMGHVAFSARLERELSELEDQQELLEFMQELGIEGSVLDRVIGRTYDLLGLITFLTAGEKEVRSWPLKRGKNAWEAAGVIHSDIQKGFIRAEVLGWEDFLACKTFKKAREQGVLRLEGKEYIVRDGDIITFRFNV